MQSIQLSLAIVAGYHHRYVSKVMEGGTLLKNSITSS